MRPFPIFPSLDVMLAAFPDICSWLPSDLTDDQYSDFLEVGQFLIYKSRGSAQTYYAYRSDLEGLLLWTWCIKQKTLTHFDRNPYDVEGFLGFLHNPPRSWVASGQRHHVDSDGFANPEWRPFKFNPDVEGVHGKGARSKTIKRTLSQSTINRIFSSMSSLFSYLQDQDYLSKNPIPVAKSHSSYNIKKPRPEPTSRHLSKEHWVLVKHILTDLAEQDPKFERALFAVLFMKTCYLRISEISTYSKRGVTMGQFKPPNRNRDCWVFEAFGKGLEIREVTVPDAFLPHLIRYRTHRNLTPLPNEGENTPLITKLRGSGSMGVRQATRMLDEVFSICAKRIRLTHGDHDAETILATTTHFLRHTGVTFDLEERPIKHLQIELGHKSSRTTDEIYAGVDRKALIQSGKNREV